MQILSADGKALWVSATDGHDVAAIRANDVAVRAPHPQNGKFEALFMHDFATDSETFDGRAVFVYGYPGLVGYNLLTRAVTRGGVVAWTDPNGASSNVFLIDAAIVPGNSGGPVFGVPGGINPSGMFVIGTRAPLLGIVSKSSGTQFQNSTGQTITLQGFGSLGIIEPAAEIRKLLAADMGVRFLPAPAPSPVAPSH